MTRFQLKKMFQSVHNFERDQSHKIFLHLIFIKKTEIMFFQVFIFFTNSLNRHAKKEKLLQI